MTPLRETIKDTLSNQLQKPGRSSAVSTAASWAQRAAQRTPGLNKLTGLLATPPPSRRRPGTGQRVVLGSGKGGAIAITHPGADSSAKPGVPGEILYGEGLLPSPTSRSSILRRQSMWARTCG